MPNWCITGPVFEEMFIMSFKFPVIKISKMAFPFELEYIFSEYLAHAVVVALTNISTLWGQAVQWGTVMAVYTTQSP